MDLTLDEDEVLIIGNIIKTNVYLYWNAFLRISHSHFSSLIFVYMYL